MFSLFKFLVFLLPSNFILWLGEPFKFLPESDIRKWSEEHLKEKYVERQIDFYGPRIGAAAIVLVIGFIFLGLWIFIPVIAFWITFGLGGLLIAIDGVMLLARFVHASKEQAVAATKGELIVIDDFKDTSLQALLNKRQREIDEFKIKFEEQHGRPPTHSDLRYS